MASVLAGVTVLDVSEYIAGPYCAALLADLGARVIKVEPPDGAEERRLGKRRRYRGNTRMALAFNHGKERLAVDLRRDAGRAILYELIAKVDVVIQNYPPSVAQKLGIDYPALAAKNPALIFLSSTAFGEVGPYRKRKGFDIIAHAASGIMANYADAEGAPRGPGAVNHIDISTGVYNAFAIVAALYHRARTGEGQKQPSSYWIERLEAAGVPCGSVNYRPHLYNDPQVHALDMMWHLDDAELGADKTVGHPLRFSKTPARPGRGAPTLGQDSEPVLLDFGWSAEAIRRLKEQGVVK